MNIPRHNQTVQGGNLHTYASINRIVDHHNKDTVCARKLAHLYYLPYFPSILTLSIGHGQLIPIDSSSQATTVDDVKSRD